MVVVPVRPAVRAHERQRDGDPEHPPSEDDDRGDEQRDPNDRPHEQAHVDRTARTRFTRRRQFAQRVTEFDVRASLQHFVDASPELNSGTGRLQAAYLDHLVPRPDGRYLVFFVKTDNRIMNAFLRRFFAATGTPDAMTKSIVELWSRTTFSCRDRVRSAYQ